MWNYRIIKRTPLKGQDVDEVYGIYEVFYNDSGEIFAHDEKPMIVGSSVKEIKDVLKNIEVDINKYNVIDGDSLKFADID